MNMTTPQHPNPKSLLIHVSKQVDLLLSIMWCAMVKTISSRHWLGPCQGNMNMKIGKSKMKMAGLPLLQPIQAQ